MTDVYVVVGVETPEVADLLVDALRALAGQDPVSMKLVDMIGEGVT